VKYLSKKGNKTDKEPEKQQHLITHKGKKKDKKYHDMKDGDVKMRKNPGRRESECFGREGGAGNNIERKKGARSREKRREGWEKRHE